MKKATIALLLLMILYTMTACQKKANHQILTKEKITFCGGVK